MEILVNVLGTELETIDSVKDTCTSTNDFKLHSIQQSLDLNYLDVT